MVPVRSVSLNFLANELVPNFFQYISDLCLKL